MKWLIAVLCLVQHVCFAHYEVVEDEAKLPILTTTLKDRKTAKLRLENGLEVYLVSDPGSDQSAAALAVEAGSWMDPKEYPGMAHFLEHMLFMGTAAYPKEFEYMQYIHDNGGTVNAYTATDRTVYIFSINNDAFEGALDRFSHFFIDPLFSPSCIGRELHAVDQEHAKNIEHDGWRQYMVFKETGNPAHPNCAFSTGNAKTLSGIPQTALKEWYQKNYSANRMHLVVISPLPIETLTALVDRDFSRVEKRPVAPSKIYGEMASAEQKGHLLALKPIKDLKVLSLAWELPKDFAMDQEKKVIELVAYVLGNESETSLLHVLKKEKLAENINVSADRFSRSQLLFSIEISLTEAGLAAYDKVIERCFQAIAALKKTGIPPYIFDEMKTLALLDYQYQSREDAYQFVQHHAAGMVYEDLSTYPEKSAIAAEYDPELAMALIESLKAQTCLFTLIADPALSGIAPTTKEKWMNAEYAFKEFPRSKLTAWNSATPNAHIQLPRPNPFIPEQLSLVSAPAESSPSLIADDAEGKIYFAADTRYFVPEASLLFGLKSPLIDGSTKKIVLLDLYIKALREKLQGTLFFAGAASLSADFAQKDLKLLLTINGYSDKAPILAKEAFQALKNALPGRDHFEILKISLLSTYDNASKELPVSQANELLSSLIYNDAPLSSEKLKALKGVTYEEFSQFTKALWKQAYVEGLFYGNLTTPQVNDLWSDLKAQLSSEAYPVADQHKRRLLILPEKPYLIKQTTERQGNGVILLVQEGPFSFQKRGLQQILSKALQDGFFETLRTKQQTAYMAKAWDLEVERQLLQLFAVQSNTHHPRDLIARFELFLEDFVKNFPERLPQERFENIQNMLVTTLKMPPEKPSWMAKRLFTLAFDYQGDFNWIEQRIASIESLTYEEVQEAALQFFSRSNARRLAILMEGVLPPENDFQYQQVSLDEMRGVGTYVSWK